MTRVLFACSEYHARSGSMTSSAYLGLASDTATRRTATDRYTGAPVVLDWRDGAVAHALRSLADELP